MLAILMFSFTFSQEKSRVSYYGKAHHGKRTASGEVFNMYGLTCASNIHSLGTKLRVTNPENGKSVIVKVNDRGGFSKYGRVLDLSQGAFQSIASLKKGIITIIYEVVKNDE